jgi:hypothetical protein
LKPPSFSVQLIDSAGFRGRLFRPVSDRKLPAAPYGGESECKAESGSR